MGKCPECGKDLEGLDPKGHALGHWPEVIPPDEKYAEARRRQKIVLEGGEE